MLNHKLKLFWNSRKTWNYAFMEWQRLFSEKWDEVEGSYWFWEALNNYNNFFDDYGL